MVTSSGPLPEPELVKPLIRQPFFDPVFGTRIVRLTDAKANNSQGYVCYYPKLDPCNADDSRLLIYERGGSWHVYEIDGTYVGRAPIRNGQTDPQPRWHPTDPNIIYWFDADKIMQYDFSTRRTTVIHQFPSYEFITAFDEGNFSADGRLVAFAGRKWPWFTGLQEFQVFDLSSKSRVGRPIEGTGHEVDWVSMSPSGNYMVIHVGRPHGSGLWQGLDVYRVAEMEYVPHGYFEFSAHADLGFDAAGDEVYVTDSPETPYPDRLRHVEMFRLEDGHKTDLLGMAWGLSRLVSCRNFAAPGWAIISTYGSPEHLAESTVHPFDDEIFALKLDGSYEVRRLAHHRSQRFSTGDYSYNNYWDQPNAAISRSGKYILFSSNWRELGAPQDVFLIDLSNQDGWIAHQPDPVDGPPIPPQNVRIEP